MQIIKTETRKVKPTKLANGTVYTWGGEHSFYLACADGLAVCLNTGIVTSRVKTNNNREVRVVSGAFHAED